ncbi:DUF3105 domain-containing protein [Deinococcus petrolearius]|uniref:DUF3105 domain-containing protein n=1 Tax=Deinococcus petrolearius TaxID=1751295 RepID=A0ABW1DL31_9DEIO
MKVRPLPLLLLSALTACAEPPLAGLRTFSYVGGDVRSGSVAYAQSPPAGGPYNALWQTCGVYPQPVYDEYAVHTLARGAVWLTYRPGLDPTEVTRLRALLAAPAGAQAPPSLLSPRENLGAPIVATAWNAQLGAQTADDPRLVRFVRDYAGAQTAPEQGAPCGGGYAGTR